MASTVIYAARHGETQLNAQDRVCGAMDLPLTDKGFTQAEQLADSLTDKGIEAGMPYLIFSPTTQYLRVKNTDANGFSADAKAVRLADNNGNQVCFSSSWNTRVTEGLYGIPAQQNVKILESVLIRTSGEQAFRPTRCGFNWEAQSPNATKLEIKHVSSSDVTAINAAKVDNADSDVYDLQGRRLNSKPAKGVIIQNGRKVAVK